MSLPVKTDRRHFRRSLIEAQHTRMNIQAQPGLPPLLIWSTAAASNPEKALDNDDAV